MAEHYSCNYSGHCEPDEYGIYPSFAECQDACRSQSEKEMLYLIHEYDLESAKLLTPSDQVQVLRRLTGVTVHPLDAREIIDAILVNDFETLAKVDELLPWIRRVHPYSLVFEIPRGSLSAEERIAFHDYTDRELKELILRHGIIPANLQSGDVIRVSDISVQTGNLLASLKTGNVRRIIYQVGQMNQRGVRFQINSFNRVDYFRYSIPVQKVLLVKRRFIGFYQAHGWCSWVDIESLPATWKNFESNGL
jgi:hypothetical protein